MPRVKDFDFPQPQPKPTIVDRLAARVDAPAPAPSTDPVGDLRGITCLQIGALAAAQARGEHVDTGELLRLANVLKTLEAAPEREPEERVELDLSWCTDDECQLLDLVFYPRDADWQKRDHEARLAKHVAQRTERDALIERARRCKCQP